jgi:uncharacterized protein YbaP (TraB family)
MESQSMSQNPSLSSDRKTGHKAFWWTLGVAAALVLIAIISVSVQVNSKHQSKIDSMTATADRIIPESDWVENRRIPVTGESNCVSFDQDCYVLHRSWEAEEPVDIEKMADQLGIPMEHTNYPEDCMRSTEDGGRTEICAYDSPSLGNWQIALRIRER